MVHTSLSLKLRLLPAVVPEVEVNLRNLCIPVGGSSSGDCRWIAKTMLGDGTIVGNITHGAWERIGQEARSVIKLNNNLSDGRNLRCEAILDHENGTFSGTIYSID